MIKLTLFATMTVIAVVGWSFQGTGAQGAKPLPSLEARAVLPADTFLGGPASGSQLGNAPINGRTPPFPGQPVQGISALIAADNDSYWALSDNGFGAQNNSRDYLLRAYRVRLDFETEKGGSGTVAILGFVQFRDPDDKVSWPIVNEGAADRLLTGADFDIESLRMARDGSFWVGDEFGPFLLHFSADGVLLEAPIPLPGVVAPENPLGGTVNLPSSRGFEGTALSRDGKTLYPTLEGPLTTDSDQRRRWFFEFDIDSRSYTGNTWQYRMEAPGNAFGDVTALDSNRLLVIERDGGQGAAAVLKHVYVVDLRVADEDGFLVKHLVLDLLNINDPNEISLPAAPGDIGLGNPFSFPFVTIESILPLDRNRLLIANDNNYPFSTGRNPGSPDNTEFIIVRVDTLSSVR